MNRLEQTSSNVAFSAAGMNHLRGSSGAGKDKSGILDGSEGSGIIQRRGIAGIFVEVGRANDSPHDLGIPGFWKRRQEQHPGRLERFPELRRNQSRELVGQR